jgi:hypothetical protein
MLDAWMREKPGYLHLVACYPHFTLERGLLGFLRKRGIR